VAALADTNLLVYAWDPRDPAKQQRARRLLHDGFNSNSIRIAHQAVIEFVSVITRPLPSGKPILTRREARQETEEILAHVSVLYPNVDVLRAALRGHVEYQLSWYDAHMLAYAEVFGLTELLSEDFQHGRVYGNVRVVNPFL